MCKLTIVQNNLNDAEETRSNVTASSIVSEADQATVSLEEDDENISRQEVNSSSSHRRNGDDPFPPHQELQKEIVLIQLTEALVKCQAMIQKQRNLLRGFHEMAEDVDRLRREYEIINAENRMWKADLEREKWMHTQQIRIRMRNISASPVERRRSRGGIMLRGLVKNLSTRR